MYQVKYHSDGYVIGYKARLVAKGYTQTEEVEYHETFAPIMKLFRVCCLISVATVCGSAFYRLDLNNTFLHSDLTEELYMAIAPSFFRRGSIVYVALTSDYYMA